MSETPDRTYRIDWHESVPFIRIFESLPLSVGWAAFSAAFLGVALTLAVGSALDLIWPSSSKPLTASVAGGTQSELDVYLSNYGSGGTNAVEATRAWAEPLKESKDVQRIGISRLLVQHASRTITAISAAVFAISPAALVGALGYGLAGVLWLLSMHMWYALFFGVSTLFIWGVCGGAISRAALMQFSRDESVSRPEAFVFALRRAGSLFGAAITPVLIIVAVALVLYIGGWIGAIPWIGEILVGLLFIFVVLLGFAAGLSIIFAFVAYPLLAPAVVAEDRDALDACSTAGSYVTRRPWKLAFYYLVALAYGGLCIQVAKWVVTLALWAGGTSLGLSMNHGDAFGRPAGTDKTRIENKLDAMWLPPSFVVNRPFYGVPTELELHHASWLGRALIKLWILLLYMAFAAFVMSLFFSAATIIFLLLRREVDYADISEVYLEEPNRGGAGASYAGSPS